MSTTKSMTDLISELQAILSAHNASELTPQAQQVSWDTVLAKLAESGFTSLETIREIKFEDLSGLPQGVARALVTKVRSFFAGSGTVTGAISAPRAPNVPTEVLIDRLDPTDGTVVIRRELRRRLRDEGVTGDPPFVVVTRDGKILRDKTLQVFNELIAHPEDEPRDYITVDGEELEVLRPNEVRNIMVHVHPLRPDRNLRSDGTDAAGINWTALPEQVRQFFLIGARAKLDGLGSLDDKGIVTAYERAQGTNPLATLRLHYPDTWAQFRDLRDDDDLPKLVRRSRRRNRGRSSKGGGNVMNLARNTR